MIKKTVTYTNYNGVKRTAEFYFNLNKYELTQMMVGEENVSFQDYLNKMIQTNDASEMVRLVKDLLLMSYGEKSSDGERFIKNDKMREDFENSAAFSELYIQFVQDTNEALEFVWGILPPDMRPDPETLQQIRAENAQRETELDTTQFTVVTTDVTN